MSELKNQVEAILFATGKSISYEEIAKLCNVANIAEILKRVKEIGKDYTERGSPLMIIEEGDSCKLTVREKFLPLVKRIIADTELAKTVLETLAVIAWKQPMKQSEVIKIRTNKAYEHIKELEDLGFLTREKHGRTRLIKLTEKFFNYFELTGGKDIRDVFSGIKDLEVDQKKVGEFDESVGNLQVYEDVKGAENKEEGFAKPSDKMGELDVVDAEPKEFEEKPDVPILHSDLHIDVASPKKTAGSDEPDESSESDESSEEESTDDASEVS